MRFLDGAHYNLKQICPKLLYHKDSYIKSHRELYSFSSDADVLRKLSRIAVYDEDGTTIGSNARWVVNYLSYNVLTSFLREGNISLKSMEAYYVDNLLTFSKRHGLLMDNPLADFMKTWNNVERVVKWLQQRVTEFESFKAMYPIYWNDGQHLFKEEIPVIGINSDDSVSLIYFANTYDIFVDISKDYLDILRIPALCQCLRHFYDNQIQIKDLTIIWFMTAPGLITNKMTAAIYKNIEDEELKTAITTLYTSLPPGQVYRPNLYRCMVCPYRRDCEDNKTYLKIK